MQKALCMVGMAVAIILVILFVLDLISGIPFRQASFLMDNILPIKESGQLKFVNTKSPSGPVNPHYRPEYLRDVFPGFDVMLVNGHTDAMMIPHLNIKRRTVVYMADLLPSVHHIPVAWVMAYDTRPLLTMSEKKGFLDSAASQNFVLFLEHDPNNQCCTVEATEKGVRLQRTLRLDEL